MAQQLTACCKEFRKILSCFSNDFQNMKTAIDKDDLELFQSFFIKKKVRIQDYEEDTGNNPLHLTVKSNRYSMVEYILTDVENVQKEDKNFDGDTPLMLAVLFSDINMVKMLVERGHADVNTKESEGFTPFMAACSNGKLDIVQYFIGHTKCNIYSKNQQGQTAIHRAAFYGEVPVLRLLKSKPKFSLTSRDSRGNTCLHFAAMRLNMTCFRYILKKLGAELGEIEMTKTNQEGLTAVQLLTKAFNMIRKDDRVITEQEVLIYVKDKTKPPFIQYESAKDQKPTIFQKFDSPSGDVQIRPTISIIPNDFKKKQNQLEVIQEKQPTSNMTIKQRVNEIPNAASQQMREGTSNKEIQSLFQDQLIQSELNSPTKSMGEEGSLQIQDSQIHSEDKMLVQKKHFSSIKLVGIANKLRQKIE